MSLINCEECKQPISDEASVCPRCSFRRFKPNPADKAARRKLAENETQNDLGKSDEHLLDDIHDESLDRTRPESETVARTMARFAALLVNLSRQSAKTADKNLKIQNNLILLTVLLLILTFLMFLLQIVDFINNRESSENSIDIRYHHTLKDSDFSKILDGNSVTNK